jgi:hypothetical protein
MSYYIRLRRFFVSFDQLIFESNKFEIFQFCWHIVNDVEVYLIACLFLLHEIKLIFVAQYHKNVVQVIIVQTYHETVFMFSAIFRKHKSIAILNVVCEILDLIDKLIGSH